MNIHIFNPEHDIALAANSKFWTAPHAGRQLRSDLGWLPVLWAKDGDLVVVNDTMQAENAVRKIKFALPSVLFTTLANLKRNIEGKDICIMPWGWDLSIVHQLRRAGIKNEDLPSESLLERIRQISDRATSSRLLKGMCDSISYCIGESKVLHSVEEIAELEKEWQKIVLKAPWSSSGRGVRYMDDRPHNIIMWAEKVIKTQGHIMAERFLDKVADFGMEFYVHPDGKVTYEGLSFFDTTLGAYTGSILATEEEKVEQLIRYIPELLLVEIQQYICRWMNNELNGQYTGPFGVDMMICKDADGTLKVNPCVEINLRRTMGHVALSISPKHSGMQQLMRIGYEGTNYHFRIFQNHELLF